jgi:hypothetical protein
MVPVLVSIVYTLPAPSSATPTGARELKSELVAGARGVVVPADVVEALSSVRTEPATVLLSAMFAIAFCQLPEGNAIDSAAERWPAADGVAVAVAVQSTELSAFWVQVDPDVVTSGVAVSAAVDPVTVPLEDSGR